MKDEDAVVNWMEQSVTEWRVLWKAETLLGESPLWVEDSGHLLFVDIKRPGILSWHPDGPTARYPLPAEVGCIVRRRRGGLLAVLRTGLAAVSLDPYALEMLCSIETDLPGNRPNDGKCDAQGRLWVATMDDAEQSASGAVWRVESNLTMARTAGGHVVGNGFGWSPDGTTMYFTDSAARTIFAYPFDQATGTLGERRVFARIPADAGFPDGLTVDRNGFIWSAHWDGARVTRYRADGQIERVVGMPVPRPTSVAFGGSDLSRLFVTSASVGLSPEEMSRAPLSGSLFEIDAPVGGLPEPRFAG